MTARRTATARCSRFETWSSTSRSNGGVVQREIGRVHAVDGVSFDVDAGETLGLVGESGCGKSTLGRCVVRLLEPTAGEIIFDGRTDHTSLAARSARRSGASCRSSSRTRTRRLNPRKRVGSIIGDAARASTRRGTAPTGASACEEMLRTVGLSPEHYNRYPHEFSGGQRQRIGLARSLALEPDLLVADEPVSALDVSIQAQMINLLDVASGEVRAHAARHRPRPRRRPPRLRPHRGHVPRQAHGGLRRRRSSTRIPRTRTRSRCSRPSRSPIQTSRTGGRASCSPETCRARRIHRRRAASTPGAPTSSRPAAATRSRSSARSRRGHTVACHWAEDIRSGNLKPNDVAPAAPAQEPVADGG